MLMDKINEKIEAEKAKVSATDKEELFKVTNNCSAYISNIKAKR